MPRHSGFSRNDGNKATAHLGIHYDDTPYATASGSAWRLDVMGDGAGTGTGPSYHQTMSVGLRGVKISKLDLRIARGRYGM